MVMIARRLFGLFKFNSCEYSLIWCKLIRTSVVYGCIPDYYKNSYNFYSKMSSYGAQMYARFRPNSTACLLIGRKILIKI